jgi:two-component system NarL family sensor kinase
LSSGLAVGLSLAVVLVAGAAALYLIVSERRRHEEVERENARLLTEATLRQAERSDLTDRIITAEQDERRRLALFLHDGPVQNLAGIALMLDAAVHAIADDRGDDAREIISSALDKHRDTIRSLRDLSFNIEPVVLRDQGFVPAVQELANQLGIQHALRIELDVDAAERLGEKEQVGLYQIIRESLNQAVRRGPPTRITVLVREVPGGGVETIVADNGKGERRKALLDALAERVRTLNGRFSVDQGADGGTKIHVVLPAYAADAPPDRSTKIAPDART